MSAKYNEDFRTEVFRRFPKFTRRSLEGFRTSPKDFRKLLNIIRKFPKIWRRSPEFFRRFIRISCLYYTFKTLFNSLILPEWGSSSSRDYSPPCTLPKIRNWPLNTSVERKEIISISPDDSCENKINVSKGTDDLKSKIILQNINRKSIRYRELLILLVLLVLQLQRGPPYWCTSLVHQYGGQKCLREEKKILLPKSWVFTSA